MKTVALVLLLALATPAAAAAVTVHDENVHGDLSTNPAAPTPLAFGAGSNVVIGRVFNSNQPNPTGDRDFWTFTVGPNQTLTAINVLAFAPINVAFAGINEGSTGYVPDFDTDPFFLSGIHVSGFDVGTNLLDAFVNEAVTYNALPAPMLGPGTYTFIIQQATNTTTSYSLDFVLEQPVPAHGAAWGAIKSLYR